jgi:hypothetical protein
MIWLGARLPQGTVSRNNAKGDRVSKLAGRWCLSVKPNNELAHGNQATVMNNIDTIGFVIVIVLLVWLFVLKR